MFDLFQGPISQCPDATSAPTYDSDSQVWTNCSSTLPPAANFYVTRNKAVPPGFCNLKDSQIQGFPPIDLFPEKEPCKVMEFLHYLRLISFNSKSPQFLRIPAANVVTVGGNNHNKCLQDPGETNKGSSNRTTQTHLKTLSVILKIPPSIPPTSWSQCIHSQKHYSHAIQFSFRLVWQTHFQSFKRLNIKLLQEGILYTDFSHQTYNKDLSRNCQPQKCPGPWQCFLVFLFAFLHRSLCLLIVCYCVAFCNIATPCLSRSPGRSWVSWAPWWCCCWRTCPGQEQEQDRGWRRHL